MTDYPSALLEKAVNEFSRLPGVGRKTALRFCLHLLKLPPAESEELGQTIIRLRTGIRQCEVCHNLSDSSRCSICNDRRRDTSVVCIVESIRDVLAIENTTQFRGVYHVLGGIISPMEGIGPTDLSLPQLEERAAKSTINEFILALPATLEGDTTSYYIYRKLSAVSSATFSTIARGIAVGDELEYTDEITLGRSILNRTPYHSR
ncbi:MAG TPA: recombination protein RecR [Bacteroidales bacterium]|nr:MAG: recombination protein RecR [Bacteroidetes bacterium GWE2_42_24]OFY26224.1 MAG: recombination protein RecR [Bacteroidetes bacterium GWF2_43_11]HBZ67499.1 recombination protein RecR [Bacteroidales bacterium]